MHRRQFLQSAGSAYFALTLPSYADTATPLGPRVTLDKFVADPKKVAALKKGVGTMKARKPSDPTSWFFQAAVHGVTPALVTAAAAIDPAVNQVDKKYWNQCPHFGNASSADFMIWHRGYVYYFERILRAASGDPSFTLPYWNYEDPKQRGCPQIFGDADVDRTLPPDQQVARNPLYDARRETAWVRGLYELSEQAVSTKAAFAADRYFDSNVKNAFGGDWQDLEPNSQGLLERSPHNLIHYAIGGVISTDPAKISDDSAAGLMADPTTSAFDPLFWAHHSNIDRLWNVWGCQDTASWGNVPPNAWLDASPWWFFDNDGSIQNHPRRSYIDSRALGVSFDDEKASCTPLTSRPLKSSGNVLVAESVKPNPLSELSTSLDVTGPVSLSASTETVTKLDLVPSPLEKANTDFFASNVARTYLELSNVQYDAPPSVGFEIYVALDGQSSPVSVGQLNLFGLKHGSHMHDSSHGQRFDITDIYNGVSGASHTLHISVRPFDLLTPTQGGAPIQRAGGVRIGGFKIVRVVGAGLPTK